MKIENNVTPKKNVALADSPAKGFSTPKNTLPVGKSPLATISNNEPVTPFARRAKIPFKWTSSGEENTPPTRPLTKSSRTSRVRPKPVETPFTGKKAPPRSESKLRPKLEALPKFVLETPYLMKSAPRTKKKPFKIYDEESSISLSELKNSPIMTKESSLENISKDIVPTKKVLFPQSSSQEGKDFSDDFASLSIVRKAKRANGLKTYGKPKPQEKKEPEFKHPASTSISKESHKNPSSKIPVEKSNSFSLNEMEKVINDVKMMGEPVRKVNLRRGASGNLVNKQRSESKLSSSERLEEKRTRSCNIPKEDCDIVEGTPSPPGSSRFGKKVTRKVRSNKS